MARLDFDSNKPVSELHVALVARDCAGSLPYTLDLFQKWEDKLACRLHFVFVENGSTDDTHQKLEEFLAWRHGHYHDGGSDERACEMVGVTRT